MNQEQLRKEAMAILAEHGTQTSLVQLEEYIDDDNSVLKLKWCLEAIEVALTKGAEIKAQQDKWVELPVKERFLSDGLYLLRIFQPETNVEDFLLFKCDAENRIINYHYATHYMPLNITPPKTSKQ